MTIRAKVMRYTHLWVTLLWYLAAPAMASAQGCPHAMRLRPSPLPDTLSAQYLAMAQGHIAVALPDSAPDARRFAAHTRASVQRLVTSGRLLDGDALTQYVRHVHERVAVAARQPSTVAYIERDHNANAYAWQSGTIVVTLGLLAQLDNEAQLAFVLAHELAHYTHRHAFVRYRAGGADEHQRMADELAADSIALQWLHQAGYPTAGVEALLLRLQSPTPWPRLDWKTHLSSRRYQVSPSADCAYEGFSAFQPASMLATGGGHFSASALAVRTEALRRWRAHLPSVATPSQVPLSPCLRAQVTVELIHALYRASRYEASLYLAFRRMQDTPDAPYLREVIAHSAYALQLTAFAERQPQWVHPDVASLLSQADYAAYCCLLNNLNRTAQLALWYGLIEAQAQAQPQDEYMTYLRCLSAQLLGSAAALNASCTAYLSQFPDGAYRAHVQSLLP